MAYSSIVKGIEIPDSKREYKEANRIGRYRVGKSAIFVRAFPFDKYIPYSSIRHVWTQQTQINVTGCCGKSLPVEAVLVMYDKDNNGASGLELTMEKFILDTREEATAMYELLINGCPGVSTESPYRPLSRN